MTKRIPPTRFPDAAAVQYARRMKELINEMHKVTLEVFDEEMKPAIQQYRWELRADAYREDSPLDIIRRALDVIKTLSLAIFPSYTVKRIVEGFINQVDRSSAMQVENQLRIKGIQPTDGLWLDAFKRSAVAENVTLIKDVHGEYLKSVEVIINHGTRTGKNLAEIREDLQNRLNISRNRADLIARDQTGTIFGQITERRHKDAGIRKFKWSTSKDERVRPEHQKRDGQIYSYDDPPDGELPSQPIACRCIAIPVFDDEEDEE